MLARVLAVGYAETKLEVEALQHVLSEEMPLHHAEFTDRLVPHGELNPEEKNRNKSETDIYLTHSCLNIGGVKCLSTMRNLLTGLSPTVNSTLKRRTKTNQTDIYLTHLCLKIGRVECLSQTC